MLNLNGSKVGDVGIKGLFLGLKMNKVLERLYLSDNDITDRGGLYICEYFYDEHAGEI